MDNSKSENDIVSSTSDCIDESEPSAKRLRLEETAINKDISSTGITRFFSCDLDFDEETRDSFGNNEDYENDDNIVKADSNGIDSAIQNGNCSDIHLNNEDDDSSNEVEDANEINEINNIDQNDNNRVNNNQQVNPDSNGIVLQNNENNNDNIDIIINNEENINEVVNVVEESENLEERNGNNENDNNDNDNNDNDNNDNNDNNDSNDSNVNNANENNVNILVDAEDKQIDKKNECDSDVIIIEEKDKINENSDQLKENQNEIEENKSEKLEESASKTFEEKSGKEIQKQQNKEKEEKNKTTKENNKNDEDDDDEVIIVEKPTINRTYKEHPDDDDDEVIIIERVGEKNIFEKKIKVEENQIAGPSKTKQNIKLKKETRKKRSRYCVRKEQDNQKIASIEINSDTEDEEDLKKFELLKGDAIGNTVYSGRFALSTLLKLEKIEKDGELNEILENDLCTLWDMTINEDVVIYLHSNQALDIMSNTIKISENRRLVEILVGIIGNMSKNEEVRCDIAKNTNINSILFSLVSCTDTQTLLQLMRLYRTLVIEEGNEAHWLSAMKENEDFIEGFTYVLSNSQHDHLLLSTLETLDTMTAIFSETLRNGLKERFYEIFVKEALLRSTITAFETLLTKYNILRKNYEKDKVDDDDNDDYFDDTESEHDDDISDDFDYVFDEKKYFDEKRNEIYRRAKKLRNVPQKLMSSFLGIHVVLSKYGLDSDFFYNEYQPNLIKCINQILSSLCNPLCLLPLTSYECGIIENISEIFLILNDPFHELCFAQMITMWHLIYVTVDLDKPRDPNFINEVEDNEYMTATDTCKTIINCTVRSARNATHEQLKDALCLHNRPTIAKYIKGLNSIKRAFTTNRGVIQPFEAISKLRNVYEIIIKNNSFNDNNEQNVVEDMNNGVNNDNNKTKSKKDSSTNTDRVISKSSGAAVATVQMLPPPPPLPPIIPLQSSAAATATTNGAVN